MRIISGTHRSRIIKMVGVDTTRETTDKVRGAIFNLIQPIPVEGAVLDLFSGSGAMGLEALSRGAKFAYFNDLGSTAYKVTKENIKSLKYEDVTKVTNLDYKAALKTYQTPFQIVFLDPPYKLDVCGEILEYLDEANLIEDKGLVVCEVDKETKIDETTSLKLYKEKTYGIRKVYLFRKD